ncbi:MAG: hypothetical protein DRI84_07900 [Bacteroidetes bacterium]|nr:MAG: hypothetical protein DRI84_07900 [Bacteroidota bacterium]
MDIEPIDSEFSSYIKTYVELKGSGIRNMSILFHTLPGSVIGVCYYYSNGDREIYIDPSFWYHDNTTYLDRELLIFHELGHCDLGRDHEEPLSIMEKYHIGDSRYSSDIEYYKRELVGLAKKKDSSLFSPTKAHTHNEECSGIIRRDL